MNFIPSTWDIQAVNIYDLIEGFTQAPTYHLIFEVLLILWIVKLIFSKSYTPERTVLTEKEKDEMIAEWKPEPLVPDIDENHHLIRMMEDNIIQGRVDKTVCIRNIECLNMACLNFLGMAGESSIEEVALKALRKYGVGSCGPRGFYGTMDVHLELEEKLADFMNCEEAVLYSYGFVTIASAIPAYCKKGDVIFCDEGVCFSIQKGLSASRSEVRYFKHNDMEDLENLLIKQQILEKKNVRKAKATRKFMIVEGLYIKHGDICPLPKLVEFKYKYKVRIFLEESFSFAVLGKTGRGITEHFDVSVDDIDLIAASLENAIGSTGGFCSGKKYIVDHQRLSGLGYCFSASQPPLLAASSMQALKIIRERPNILSKLRECSESMHKALDQIPGMKVYGDTISPIKHVSMEEPCTDRDLENRMLQKIVDLAMSKGVAFTLAHYLEAEEHHLPPPSIRVAVNCRLSEEEITHVALVLKESCDQIMNSSSV